MPNYSLEDLDARAKQALVHHAGYVTQLDAAYEEKTLQRRAAGIPVVAFCGLGRTGKDTAAMWWCRTAGLVYNGSASAIVNPILATMADDTPEHCYEVRHQNKDFWIEACHAVRRQDLTIMIRMALGAGDVLVGVRCGRELHEARRLGMFDYSYWVRRSVRPDKTVEYGQEDCDSVLLNEGSVSQLYERIERLYRFVSGSFKQGAK